MSKRRMHGQHRRQHFLILQSVTFGAPTDPATASDPHTSPLSRPSSSHTLYPARAHRLSHYTPSPSPSQASARASWVAATSSPSPSTAFWAGANPSATGHTDPHLCPFPDSRRGAVEEVTGCLVRAHGTRGHARAPGEAERGAGALLTVADAGASTVAVGGRVSRLNPSPSPSPSLNLSPKSLTSPSRMRRILPPASRGAAP
ncbi:hypothetical protein BV25DRAFT_1164089 [Artomyces pyxidatus]|uniref:Uncharacterized protein n=1 Tax=Artomyces pyxidatus TaxID=48021 RepID=A0ACB8STC0_9AGAM|nr:hypothetical protein BV25DRAFT_1164089 [Artomyces pyxidatus]